MSRTLYTNTFFCIQIASCQHLTEYRSIKQNYFDVYVTKKALRICSGSQLLAHTDPLYYELKTLKVHDLNSLQSFIFMFKYTNNLLPGS